MARIVYLSLLFAIVIPRLSYGQPINRPSVEDHEPEFERFAVGGKAGMTIATFGGSDADRVGSDGIPITSTYSPGFAIDAFARVVLAMHWGIQAEAAYITKGSGTRVGEEDRASLDYSYLELSMLARTQWLLEPIHEKLAIHGLLGPSVGYLVKAQRDREDFTDSADRVDLGLHVGIGSSVKLSHGTPIFELRYYHGLVGVGGESGLDLSHRVFSILIGYEVSLGYR